MGLLVSGVFRTILRRLYSIGAVGWLAGILFQSAMSAAASLLVPSGLPEADAGSEDGGD